MTEEQLRHADKTYRQIRELEEELPNLQKEWIDIDDGNYRHGQDIRLSYDMKPIRISNNYVLKKMKEAAEKAVQKEIKRLKKEFEAL